MPPTKGYFWCVSCGPVDTLQARGCLVVVVSGYLLVFMVCGFSPGREASSNLTMDFKKYVQL